MNVKDLKAQVRSLATIEETTSPVVSCYVDLTDGVVMARAALDDRLRQMDGALCPSERHDVHAIVHQVREELRHVGSTDRGLVVFARMQDEPFFRSLRFEVSVPNWIAVGPTPNIFHLIELKDMYHRYVILLCEPDMVRILEVNLGAVTAQLWKDRPEIRRRVSSEWTKRQYQHHLHERNRRFVRDAVATLEDRIQAGGYAHLILAGNAKMIRQMRAALTPRLAEMLVDSVLASARDSVRDVVEATLAVFIDETRAESSTVLDQLARELRVSGLAVSGATQTRLALEEGRVDVLLVERRCDLAERGELVRLAARGGADTEIVEHSDLLMELGGVAALLRYRVETPVAAVT